MNTILLYALPAVGAALTNTTTETVLASTEIAAKSLQVGQVYNLKAAVKATATNSTDTLEVKVRVGPTTLTGTVVATSGAVDAANDNVVVLDLSFYVRSVSSTSAVIAFGVCSTLGAEATATARAAFEQLSISNAVAQKFEITGTWSAASASDSCRAESMILTVSA